MSLPLRSRTLGQALCAALIAAPFTSAAAQSLITISKNVHVSKRLSQFVHGEIFFGASPTDPQHLLGCAMVVYPAATRHFYMNVWLSRDGGANWGLVKDSIVGFDPACAITANGTALMLGGYAKRELELMRSLDGGTTWEAPAYMPVEPSTDRFYVAADDNLKSKYRGRIYVNSWSRLASTGEDQMAVTGHNLWTSLDSGRTFGRALKLASAPPKSLWPPTIPVVMRDGTVVAAFGEFQDGWGFKECSESGKQPLVLKAIMSKDGGTSFEKPTVIGDFCMDLLQGRVQGNYYLAVDKTEGPFRDRLYFTWMDRRTGRNEVMVTYSADTGKTWSRPVILGADRPEAERVAWFRDNFMPRVAVNKDGVVGLVWSDRRGLPDNFGYHQRFSASLDGGETWLPSVQMSEQPSQWNKNQSIALLPGGGGGSYYLNIHKFNFTGGDTGGFDADAAGNFHNFWIDNRTGVSQVWTAKATVAGAAMKHGDRDLAAWVELKGKADLKLTEADFDRASGVITMVAQVKNASKTDTLRGPVKGRLVAINSDFGAASVTGADNKHTGTGAIFDFSSLIPATGILPDSLSAPRKITFRVANVKSLDQLEGYKKADGREGNALTFTMKLYAPPTTKR